MLNGRKTTCPRGHRYFGRNLYVDPAGYRRCRRCRRVHNRRYQTRLILAALEGDRTR